MTHDPIRLYGTAVRIKVEPSHEPESITKDVLSAIAIAVFVLGTMALITGVFA